MLRFVERKTEGNRHVLVFPLAALFYGLTWPTLVAILLTSTSGEPIFQWLASGLLLALIVVAVPMWPALWELKRVMKTASITASGSKYSFSNPLRYEWEDAPPGREDK